MKIDNPKCKTCYYKTLGSYTNCDYILYTRKSRGCSVENCDKYLDKPKDTKFNIGCGSCKYYEPTDTFNGHCTDKDIDTWSYRPAPKECYRRNMKVDLPQEV